MLLGGNVEDHCCFILLSTIVKVILCQHNNLKVTGSLLKTKSVVTLWTFTRRIGESYTGEEIQDSAELIFKSSNDISKNYKYFKSIIYHSCTELL